jgi:L-fuculokinase
MTPEGKQTKASRVFFGKEHDYQVERIAAHFGVDNDFFKSVAPVVGVTSSHADNAFTPNCMEGTGPFPKQRGEYWDISQFPNAETAYLALMRGLMSLLKTAIELVDNGVATYFVDGGFARNAVFMEMLKQDFPTKKIETRDVPQATALGALLRLKN